MRPDDAAPISAILKNSPEAVFWTEEGVKEVLGWNGTVALVSETGTTLNGFLIARQISDEAEILNLAVAEANRRTGLGRALLLAAEAALLSRGVKRIFLEVRESNHGGIAFYTKHGFRESGRRIGYYREPNETALLMEKSFGT